MDTNDKKTEVLELLSQTNDSNLIDEVYEILHPESAVENINIAELSGELQQKINKALEDYKSGNYITHGADETKSAAIHLSKLHPITRTSSPAFFLHQYFFLQQITDIP